METVPRTQTAFRLKDSLLQTLKWKAKKANMSLNAYVEETLEEAAGQELEFPKFSQGFFEENRAYTERFVMTEVALPPDYKGLNAFEQAELDNKLLTEAKYEDNL